MNPWTDADVRYLKRHWVRMSDSEIASVLQIKSGGVRAKRLRLGLSRALGREWTRPEIRRLREMSTRYTASKVARKLKRPICSVCKKATDIGVEFKKHVFLGSKSPFPSHNNIIKSMWSKGFSAKEIAKALGRSIKGIFSARSRLKLTTRTAVNKILVSRKIISIVNKRSLRGDSYRSIAKSVGISEAVVIRIAKIIGVYSRKGERRSRWGTDVGIGMAKRDLMVMDLLYYVGPSTVIQVQRYLKTSWEMASTILRRLCKKDVVVQLKLALGKESLYFIPAEVVPCHVVAKKC